MVITSPALIRNNYYPSFDLKTNQKNRKIFPVQDATRTPL